MFKPKFKQGDVVIASNGQEMTVVKYVIIEDAAKYFSFMNKTKEPIAPDEVTDTVICKWDENGETKSGKFKESDLILRDA